MICKYDVDDVNDDDCDYDDGSCGSCTLLFVDGDDNDNNQPLENQGAHRTGGCVGFQPVPVGARQNLQQNHRHHHYCQQFCQNIVSSIIIIAQIITINEFFNSHSCVARCVFPLVGHSFSSK